MELGTNRGHASADRPRRVLADSDGYTMGLANYLDETLEQCEICHALDKAHRIPIAGSSTVSALRGKLLLNLLYLDDAVALRAMDVSPKHSLSIPARPKNPQEVWGELRG